MSLSRVRMDDIAGIPLIDVTESPLHGVNFVAKRLLDSVVSLAVLAILSPVLILVALAIRLDSSGPIVIAQERMGRGGRVFLASSSARCTRTRSNAMPRCRPATATAR